MCSSTYTYIYIYIYGLGFVCFVCYVSQYFAMCYISEVKKLSGSTMQPVADLTGNMKCKELKNKSKKERIWQEKETPLGMQAKALKTWYTDLCDSHKKLQYQRSGEAARTFTEQEQWLMEYYQFLRATICHRRAPVKSVKDAITQARGDLDTAERIAAEDRLNVVRANE